MAQSTTPSQDRPTQRSTPRQSNFELLRLVAMLLILIQHCLLHTEGFTDSIYAGDSPVAYYLSTLLIGCTMIAVNAFVMLSGYFGIHTSLKRILHFLSRVAVLSIGIYIYIYISVDQEVWISRSYASMR